MPYYIGALSKEAVKKIKRYQVCAVCQGVLWEYFDLERKETFLACKENFEHGDRSHEGIVKPYHEPRSLNIPNMQKELEQTMDTKNASALAVYAGKKELARSEAREIVESLFKSAPKVEQDRAILTCISYKLNPLNKHVFLIPFEHKNKEGIVDRTDWALVMGIKAKRLLASRRGTFGYVDDSPRVMTEDEQKKIFGQVKTGKLVVIVKLIDPKNPLAICPGYGEWALKKNQWSKRENRYVEVDNEPYGVEKGNSMFNMAAIRAESQALDRLRPGEMPDIGVADEKYMEGEFHEVGAEESFKEIGDRVVNEKTGEIYGPPPGNETMFETSPEEDFENLESAGSKPELPTYKREPKTVTAKDFLKICHEDFNMQPKEVFDELGIKTSLDIVDPPAAYIQIAAPRLE